MNLLADVNMHCERLFKLREIRQRKSSPRPLTPTRTRVCAS